MRKKSAKVFKKYGEKEIEVVKNYQPKIRNKGDVTTAIKGSRRSINMAIGNCILFGNEKERKIIGEALTDDYYEDWDGDSRVVIKY